jgi:multisubunit Na+/H+ antiporter MnhB subunit
MKDFIKQAFSDGGSPSSSRIISAVCALAAIGWITHVVIHSHALPGIAETGGITAFTTSHYIANRVTTAFGNK